MQYHIHLNKIQNAFGQLLSKQNVKISHVRHNHWKISIVTKKPGGQSILVRKKEKMEENEMKEGKNEGRENKRHPHAK